MNKIEIERKSPLAKGEHKTKTELTLKSKGWVFFAQGGNHAR